MTLAAHTYYLKKYGTLFCIVPYFTLALCRNHYKKIYEH
jgi:hypothetical protein